MNSIHFQIYTMKLCLLSQIAANKMGPPLQNYSTYQIVISLFLFLLQVW